MGNQPQKKKRSVDWGTRTQQITYDKCIEKLDLYHTPLNLSKYGKRVLNAAYSNNNNINQDIDDNNGSNMPAIKTLSKKDQMFLNDYKFINILGRGTYATVYKCIPSTSTSSSVLRRHSTSIISKNFASNVHNVNAAVDKVVAIKMIKRDKLSPEYEQQMKYEADLLLDIIHPHIINLVAFFQGNDFFYLVEEYVPKTLMEVLTECHFHPNVEFQLSEKGASNTMKQLLSALQFLKTKSIAHLDLKPDNLLVGINGQIRLCDFGLAAIAPCARDCHTYLFCPPEIITEQTGYCESDMWACGVCFFLLLTGYFPFAGSTWKTLQNKIVNGIPNQILEEAPMSLHAKDMIKQMLTVNAFKRLTPTNGMEHPFFLPKTYLLLTLFFYTAFLHLHSTCH